MPEELDRPRRETSCRGCRAYCDWVVEPTSCRSMGCPHLYSYTAVEGDTYALCIHGILPADVSEEILDAAVAEGQRLGGLRARHLPLVRCDAWIDTAYPRRLPEVGCVNPEFFEPLAGDPFVVIVSRGPGEDSA